MSDFSTLRATVKRGALLTVANWPVVLVQFAAESTFKLLVGVPVVGGALLVALALGRDITDLAGQDPRAVVASVGAALFEYPTAFASFVVALLIMLAGGSVLLFLAKGGTVTILAAGESGVGRAGAPVGFDTFRRAHAFSSDRFLDGARTMFRRYLRLGLTLFAVYLLTGVAYLAAVFGSYQVISGNGLLVGWTLVAVVSTSALIVWITLVNLMYLLFQMVMAVEACGLRAARRHVAGFLRAHLRDVGVVFVAVLGMVVLATAASLLATTSLGLISFVPLVGLAVLPLQAAAWLVRELVFQFLGLSALGAYLTLYRAPRPAMVPRA